jgi:hypothetical protein
MVFPSRKFSFSLHRSLGPAQPSLARDFSVISVGKRCLFNRTAFASLSRTALTTIQEDPLCGEITVGKAKVTDDCVDWVSKSSCAIHDSNFKQLLDFALFFEIDALFSLLIGNAAFGALPIERKLDVGNDAVQKGFDISMAVACICADLVRMRVTKNLLKRIPAQVARLLVLEHSLTIGVDRLGAMAEYFGPSALDHLPFRKLWKPHTIRESANINALRGRFDFVRPAARRGSIEYEFGRPFEGILNVGLQDFKVFKPARLVIGGGFGIRVSRYSIKFPDDFDSNPFSVELYGNTGQGRDVLLDSRRCLKSTSQIHLFDVGDRVYHSEFHLVCSPPAELFDLFGDVGTASPGASPPPRKPPAA